jgi:uncharacterized membrane protein YhaH (DUF805 family)
MVKASSLCPARQRAPPALQNRPQLNLLVGGIEAWRDAVSIGIIRGATQGRWRRAMAADVQLVFRGEVLDGFAADEVRRQLAQALKLDEARVAQLFTGARTVLKRSVEPALARRYVDKLAGLGAKVHVEPSDAPPTTGFAPLPELPEVPASNVPPPPPWGTPPRPTRPAPLSPVMQPLAPAPIPALALEAVEEVTCPNCNERQSKRLLCRNCSTNIEMALANRDEELAQARAARQEARDARLGRRPAARSSVGAAGSDSAGVFGLTFDGRMGRLKYATANLVLTALLYVPVIMVLTRPTLGRFALLAIAAVALTIFGMRLAVLRCHDCDKSGWWSMLLWLPTVNFIVTVVLSCAPGTDGDNDYGEQPPPSSWWGFGAAAFCLLLLVALTFSHVMKFIERQGDDAAEDDGAVTFQADPRAASLPSFDAQVSFNESYLSAKGHKAFATSPSGGWGWAATRRSPAEAARDALLDCETRRPTYTAPCVLVNMNGQWAPDR